MPRYGDIQVSFHEAIWRNHKYGVTVSMTDFVVELAKRSWEFRNKQANEWTAQTCLFDPSLEECENMIWQVSITTGSILI
ncbi:DNA polymerase V [Pantoea ananatis]|nr:DNA polymerase V [Pantoea ananatis]